MSDKLIGYKLTRPNCGGWLFLGTDPAQIGDAIRYELESERDFPIEDREQFTIHPMEITQEEIDTMPEFEGW